MEIQKQKKIIIAHPMQQHSYHSAEELEKRGMLDVYLTTIYYDSNKFIYRILSSVLKKNLLASMMGKRNPLLDSRVKTSCSILGFFYLYLIRYDRQRLLIPTVYRLLVNSFGRHVVSICKKKKPDVLIMYDSTAYSCFKKIKRLNLPIICILEMSSIPVSDIRNILLKDTVTVEGFHETVQKRLKTFGKINSWMGEEEIRLADFIITANSFCHNLLISRGKPEEKLKIAMLGIDHTHFSHNVRKAIDSNAPVVFLYVGSIEGSKGTHHLLNALKKIPNANIIVQLIGDNKTSIDLEAYDSRIEFHGTVPHARMPEIYAKADVFITTSLFEGFSLVLVEAMSCGLPVIASKNSIAADIIENGMEGFQVCPSDEESIARSIEWFVYNRDKIPIMGSNSERKTRNLTWVEYGNRLADILSEVE
jgi:glycosyltransferase involved in cell wall biosynthesis